MSTIKKAFQPIMSALAAAISINPEVTVAEVLEEIQALSAAKSGAGGGKATAFHRNEAGEVVAVKCYYHKLWMAPSIVEFGEKKSSASALNSMSKDGMSKWTKQNSAAKKEKEELLTKVGAGEIEATDIAAELDAIEVRKGAITPMEREDQYTGFETLEECLADAEENGLPH